MDRRPFVRSAESGNRRSVYALHQDKSPREDVFFTSPMYGRPNETSPQSSAVSPSQLYPYHQQAFHQFAAQPQSPPKPAAPYANYVQQSWAPVIAPPVPPKPSIYPPIGASIRPSTSYAASQQQSPASSPPHQFQPAAYTHPTPPPPVPMFSHPSVSSSPPRPAVPHPSSPPTAYPVQPSARYGDVPVPPDMTPVGPPSAALSQGSEEIASPTEDVEGLAMALAISQTESAQRKRLEEELLDQEEQDLARALAESLQMSGSNAHASSSSSSTFASSSKVPTFGEVTGDLSPLQLPIQLPQQRQDSLQPPLASAASHSTTSSYSDDGYDFGLGNYNKWQIHGLNGAAAPSGSGSDTVPDVPNVQPPSRTTSLSSVSSLPYMSPVPIPERKESLPQYAQNPDSRAGKHSSVIAAMESIQQTETDESRLVFDDEAYARQLAAEEEDELRVLIERKAQMEAERNQQPVEPPQYSTEGVLRPETLSDDSHSTHPPPSIASTSSSQTQPMLPSSSSQAFKPNRPSFHQSHTYDSRPPLTSVASSSSSSHSNHSERPHAVHSNTFPAAGPSNLANQMPTAGLLNPNHFVERELLAGVSIGFKPPAISSKLLPMEDPMPNIISLPATRCPPLHLQAPDWRHLLRLMARLSNTRIEPTVEAMAVTKTDLKLRTVIQFIKPHPSANTWRTILWFTIDHAVPPAVPGASRYLTGNPNLLPWSYTLSPVPMLLRDAADTHLSKTFTIPASEAVPLPTLPITFPNLAQYLHATLEESRRHSRSSDNGGGYGKLGKMVQMCYPNVKEMEVEGEDDIPGRSSGVTGIFKRVMGRGGKDKRKGKGSNNEETYQLVTPFVPDEWG